MNEREKMAIWEKENKELASEAFFMGLMIIIVVCSSCLSIITNVLILSTFF